MLLRLTGPVNVGLLLGGSPQGRQATLSSPPCVRAWIGRGRGPGRRRFLHPARRVHACRAITPVRSDAAGHRGPFFLDPIPGHVQVLSGQGRLPFRRRWSPFQQLPSRTRSTVMVQGWNCVTSDRPLTGALARPGWNRAEIGYRCPAVTGLMNVGDGPCLPTCHETFAACRLRSGATATSSPVKRAGQPGPLVGNKGTRPATTRCPCVGQTRSRLAICTLPAEDFR